MRKALVSIICLSIVFSLVAGCRPKEPEKFRFTKEAVAGAKAPATGHIGSWSRDVGPLARGVGKGGLRTCLVRTRLRAGCRPQAPQGPPKVMEPQILQPGPCQILAAFPRITSRARPVSGCRAQAR